MRKTWLEKYYYLRAKIKFIWGFQVINCIWFLRIALFTLAGRLHIVDTQEVKSRGGFKQLMIILSKAPVSKYHKYEDI